MLPPLWKALKKADYLIKKVLPIHFSILARFAFRFHNFPDPGELGQEPVAKVRIGDLRAPFLGVLPAGSRTRCRT
jgi:hypothetical protein